jgi:uncharacterized protein (TIRG00374 family)
MPPSDAEKSTARWAPWWGLVLRGLILSAALVFVAWGVRWHDMSDALRRAGFALPAVVVALNACMMSLRALRLRILLRGDLSFASSFVALLTSSAINNLTPFRGGNVARLWMLERAAGVTKSAAVALTLVENLLEVTVLAAIGFVASCFVIGQRWATLATPVVLSAAIAVLILLRLTTRRAADAATTARPRIGSPGWVEKGRQLLVRLEPGLRALSKPGVAAQALLLSLLAWICEATMILLCARSLGLQIPLPLATVVLLGINLALALPSTPASAGPFEGAAVAVLMLAGFAKAPAFAFAIFYHAIQVIPVTLVGVTVVLLTKRRQASQAGRLEHRIV